MLLRLLHYVPSPPSRDRWRNTLDRKADDSESGSERVYSDENGRKVEERLRSLGYLES